MMINFEERTIDLVRTYDTYEQNYGGNGNWRHKFGAPIVNLAVGVVSGYPREVELVGIRKCLAFELSRLRKREYWWVFPLNCQEMGDDIKIHNNVMLIVDSLVFSIIEFYGHLWEHHSGLSSITRTKLRRGFELACLWGGCGDLLDEEKNDWIVGRDSRDFFRYIVSEARNNNGSAV